LEHSAAYFVRRFTSTLFVRVKGARNKEAFNIHYRDINAFRVTGAVWKDVGGGRAGNAESFPQGWKFTFPDGNANVRKSRFLGDRYSSSGSARSDFFSTVLRCSKHR
jgi:hypothetical protein